MIVPQVIHLPDGQTFTVQPVFAGVGFKSHELNTHHNPMPIGWNCVLHTERDLIQFHNQDGGRTSGHHTPTHSHNHSRSISRLTVDDNDNEDDLPPRKHISPFREPTLDNDTLFLSSIANPSSTEYKPAASPTRQIAMMLWVSLYWYFHQPEPKAHLDSDAYKHIPDEARPKGDWKIWIKRDGVLRGRNLIPKLERMGLIASADTAVGTSLDDSGPSWDRMYVSKKMFWQIPGRLFLFSLQPMKPMSTFPSPATSRPGSPVRGGPPLSPGLPQPRIDHDLPGAPMPTTMPVMANFPVGPYFSSSHLPTYYPPAPMQYVYTNGVRHPSRPKPPRMGEVFYTRFIPSVDHYLSFRVASASPNPVPYLAPVGPKPPDQAAQLSAFSDSQLLQRWMANPRVKKFWGEYSPNFLRDALSKSHSFPVIGLWDGVPFGYFEIYWVKEDQLGRHLSHEIGDFDRGITMFIGEEWSRGRVSSWLTALVHWCFCVDYRTNNICLQPRVDNDNFMKRLDENGFMKVKQVSLFHKQAWFVRKSRDAWDGPTL